MISLRREVHGANEASQFTCSAESGSSGMEDCVLDIVSKKASVRRSLEGNNVARTIGTSEALAAYKQAVRVWEGEISEAQARRILAEEFEVNNASASDMIRNLAQMLKGELYHRTLNLLTTRIFFDQIGSDFGVPFLLNAIKSTRAHIDYYEALKNGGNKPSLKALCSEYEGLLPKNGNSAESLFSQNFQKRVNTSFQDFPEVRQKRLKNASSIPVRRIVKTVAYSRNPDVVAERLYQANGTCDHCKKSAPFTRISGGAYLEVHHIIPLSEGGMDVLENTAALCPNCHREAHFGIRWKAFREQI